MYYLEESGDLVSLGEPGREPAVMPSLTPLTKNLIGFKITYDEDIIRTVHPVFDNNIAGDAFCDFARPSESPALFS